MTTLEQKEAWDELYRSQFRPWRGITSLDTPFPFKEGDKIVDIGCGNGKTSLALIEAGYNVIGIDISEVAVDACDRLYKEKMRAIVASITEMPFHDGMEDGAVMIHILEHIEADEIQDAIKEVFRIIRPGGLVFVRVFHKDDMRADCGERINENTVMRGNGIKYHYFSETELRFLFSAFSEIYMERIEDRTKFGEKRSKIDAIFEKPMVVGPAST